MLRSLGRCFRPSSGLLLPEMPRESKIVPRETHDPTRPPPVFCHDPYPSSVLASAGAHPPQCSHQWSSGWRSVLQLRSCAHERCVNEIADLMQRAPRVNRNAEQELFGFLGFEPHACCDLRKKLAWCGVHF